MARAARGFGEGRAFEEAGEAPVGLGFTLRSTALPGSISSSSMLFRANVSAPRASPTRDFCAFDLEYNYETMKRQI